MKFLSEDLKKMRLSLRMISFRDQDLHTKVYQNFKLEIKARFIHRFIETARKWKKIALHLAST